MALDEKWVEGSIKELTQIVVDLEQKLARLESDVSAIYERFRLEEQMERERDDKG